MAGLNHVILIGNLTRDPELRAISSGTQVANFGVATNRVWKDRDGNKQESAEFHNVVVFGRQAETTAQYLKKGSSVLVEGRLQTRSWDSDGVKKYKTEIVADRVQFGPRRDGGSNNSNFNSSKSDDNKKKEPAKSDEIEYPSEEINPEDIPF